MSEAAERIGVGDDDGVLSLVAAWRELHADPEAELPTYQLTPTPYPGLRSFDASEGLLYFGRPGEDEGLARRLESFNVVGVLGGSGSGKSSLVLAGLLPYLRRFQRIPDRGGRWYLVSARPGQTPSTAVVDAIWRAVCAPLAGRRFGERALSATFASLGISAQLEGEDLLSACQTSLTEFLAPNGVLDSNRVLRFANEELQVLDAVSSGGMQVGAANLLIVVDQFEEIFREEVDPAGAEAIVELVKAVHHRGRQGLFITLTMRSEELHRCAEYEGLSEIIFATSIQVELLTKEKDIHAAIVEPARRVFDSWGISYEDDGSNYSTAPFARDLVELLTVEAQRLSKALDHKPDSLPLLQHALRSTWDAAVQRWGVQYSATDPNSQPEVTLGDFRYSDTADPLQACLNQCAENARGEAVQRAAKEIQGDTLSRESAASHLIDIAFTCMARLDDRGRWVRRFATTDEIATAAILDIQEIGGRGLFRQIVSLFRNRSRYSESEADKRPLIGAVLEVFRRRGYVLSRNAPASEVRTPRGAGWTFDVSHESLIRSWERYQSILEQAKSTRKALLEADEAVGLVGQRKTNRLRTMIAWGMGGKPRQAADALRRVNINDLGRLFVPPRWLGHVWAVNQLVDERLRLDRTVSFMSAMERTLAEQKVREAAETHVARIADLFGQARRWTERDGGWFSGHTKWLVKIASLPAAASIVIAVLAITNYNSAKLVAFLRSITSIPDMAQNDPIAARAQLMVSLAKAQDIHIGGLVQRISQNSDTIDNATEILGQKSRAVLKLTVGRVGGKDLLPSRFKRMEVHCSPANKTFEQPVVKTPDFELKYFSPPNAPSGYAFFNHGVAPVSQTVSFDAADKICVADDASLLLRVQPTALVFYPLTVVTLPEDSRSVDGVGANKVLPIGDPTNVVSYEPDSEVSDAREGTDIANELFNNITQRTVFAFSDGETHGFAIPVGKPSEEKFLYVSHLLGVNEPQELSKDDCNKAFVNCAPVKSGSFGNRDFDGLYIDGENYSVRLTTLTPKNIACEFDTKDCPQSLLLYRNSRDDKLNFVSQDKIIDSNRETKRVDGVKVKLTHIGLPVAEIRTNGGQYLLLLDTAGHGWRYILGWNAFWNAMDGARILTYKSN